MFKRICKLENNLSALKTEFYIFKESVGKIRFCSECERPYKRRINFGTHLCSPYPEIGNCKACDSIIEKRAQAEAIAKNCPDEVIKTCGKKKERIRPEKERLKVSKKKGLGNDL